MDLSKISFPIYKLGKEAPIEEEGVSFYLKIYETDTVRKFLPLVIDDKNMKGSTLARRRLLLKSKEIKLYTLSKAIFFIADLIKLTVGTSYYIDSTGKIFEYKKTTTVPLIFKKIKKVIPIKTGGATIEIEGISTRYKTLFLPRLECKYAGLLKVGMGYILYGLYENKLPDTKRKI